MATSHNTQRGLYGNHADTTDYFKTEREARTCADAMRASGNYRRAQVIRWNDGSRAQPRWAYMVKGWVA